MEHNFGGILNPKNLVALKEEVEDKATRQKKVSTVVNHANREFELKTGTPRTLDSLRLRFRNLIFRGGIGLLPALLWASDGGIHDAKSEACLSH